MTCKIEGERGMNQRVGTKDECQYLQNLIFKYRGVVNVDLNIRQ